MATDTQAVAITNGVPESGDEGIALTDLIGTLLRRWKWIAGAGILGGIAAAVVLQFTPNRYEATAIIMPPQAQQSAASSLLGQLGPLATMSSKDLGLKSPADLYIGILKSRTIADAVISRFQLKQLYGAPTMVKTRKILAECTRIEAGKDTLIKISVEDRDAKRAADLANCYVDELYTLNSQLAMTESGQRRLFFERQLGAERNSLAAAEADLRRTQEQTGVLQVNSQLDTVVRSLAQLRGEIVGREVALQRLRAGATSQNPEVVRQETELTALRGQLARLEASQSQRAPGDPFIPVSRLPKVGLEYIRSYRDLKYHETLFDVLAKQYEAARIDEAKQGPVIQTVDRAIPPDSKSWPPRAVIAAASALAAALLGACIVLFKERSAPAGSAA